ncbi:DNA translocase FtsK 4TM domain-containing protein [Candidatus Margulisiibacteriota bacterium]
MPKRKKRIRHTKRKVKRKRPAYKKDETTYTFVNDLYGLLFIGIGIFILLSKFFPENTGIVGEYVLEKAFVPLLGSGIFFLPLIFLVVGIDFIIQTNRRDQILKYAGLTAVMFATLTALEIFQSGPTETFSSIQAWASSGGFIGYTTSYLLFSYLGPIGSYIIILFTFFFGIQLFLRKTIFNLFSSIKESAESFNNRYSIQNVFNRDKTKTKKIKHREQIKAVKERRSSDERILRPKKAGTMNEMMQVIKNSFTPFKRKRAYEEDERDEESSWMFYDDDKEEKESYNEEVYPNRVQRTSVGEEYDEAMDEEDEENPQENTIDQPLNLKIPNYKLPPNRLLNDPPATNKYKTSRTYKEDVLLLEDALQEFKIPAKVVNVVHGPSVTRYELQPGPGVRVNKIANLSDDFSLALAVPSIRIEAPVPGKSVIGIEVPNAFPKIVTVKEMTKTTHFQNTKNELTVCLGKDIGGKAIFANINDLPHLLIAGATGSGKSVCINSIIMSLLMRLTPEQVRLLMIDPKIIELSLYNDIPHLLAPVITDPKHASNALKYWAIEEMDRRYTIFAKTKVRNMASYNKAVTKRRYEDANGERLQPIPHIIVIIDELADLMMSNREVEETLRRLAQKSRATGIHLIVATQRPSVDVITGVIKANFPSRIAFAVKSQIDSRTILDIMGAEKLMGKGDMLYSPVGAMKPKRMQGVYIDDSEINRIIKYIKKQSRPEYVNTLMNIEKLEEKASFIKEAKGKQDPLFMEAYKVIQKQNRASTSLLQRKLRIGYNRAARIMDELESQGLISEYVGENKARKIIH